MLRKIALTASAVALSAAGLGLAGSGSAYAGKPTITASTGSDVHCDVTASIKLKPALKDDWVKAQHSTDPNNDVKNLPNTPYAPAAPEHISGKASGTCTGSVTDGVNTASVTKVKWSFVDEAAFPTVDPGSCIGLIPGNPPSPGKMTVSISYTSPTAKVVATTVVHATFDQTFQLLGGTISGSFAGGSYGVQGVPDAVTIGVFGPEISGTVATSASPDAPSVCQAGLKIKPTSASLKAPKGLAKLKMDPGSTLDIQKP